MLEQPKDPRQLRDGFILFSDVQQPTFKSRVEAYMRKFETEDKDISNTSPSPVFHRDTNELQK